MLHYLLVEAAQATNTRKPFTNTVTGLLTSSAPKNHAHNVYNAFGPTERLDLFRISAPAFRVVFHAVLSVAHGSHLAPHLDIDQGVFRPHFPQLTCPEGPVGAIGSGGDRFEQFFHDVGDDDRPAVFAGDFYS